MTKKCSKRSPEYGANLERTAILAKIRRLLKEDGSCRDLLSELENWLSQRDERYQKRKGGLGK